jgi:hypothetical protein
MRNSGAKFVLIRTALLAAVLSTCAQAAIASPHPIRWVGHHKLLIATSAIMFAASAMDAQTSIDAERRCPACVETNLIVGPRPSTTAFWSFVAAGNSGVTLLNWYSLKHNRPQDKSFTVIVTGVAASLHAYAAYRNTTLPTTPGY